MRFSSRRGRHKSAQCANARRILRRSCFALALLVWPVNAADRYLRPSDACPFQGDGTSYDCAASPGDPGAFNSWASANASLGPGDTLRLDGQWTLAERWIQTTNGTANAPIRITSYDSSAPAFIGGSLGGLVYLQGDYVEVDHLSFFDDGGTCLIVGENSPLAAHHGRRIHDNHFFQCSNGISIRAVDDVGIYDNVLENIGFPDSNQGHCIYVAQGSASMEVYRNRCTVRADVFQSHCLHVYHNEPPGPARDVAFHDNVCNGFTVGAGLYNGSSGILVYGNTFIVRSSFGLRCDYGGSEGAFVNNIVIGSATYGAALYDANCSQFITMSILEPSGISGSFCSTTRVCRGS